MRVVEVVEAWGHANVTAKNRTTFEVTKEDWLTKRGDCIIAVRASKGADDLRPEFKHLARTDGSRIHVTIEANSLRDTTDGWGNRHLTLDHLTDLVARRSNYLCGRTLMVRADKAASDLSRELVQALKNPNQRVRVTIVVEL